MHSLTWGLLAASLLVPATPHSANSDTPALDTKAIVHACGTKGEPAFKGKLLGNVSEESFREAKDALLGQYDSKKVDAQMMQSVCTVAMWQAANQVQAKRPARVEAARAETDVLSTPAPPRAAPPAREADSPNLQKQVSKLQEDAKREKESTGMTLEAVEAVSLLALVFALVALYYSWSATRKALRSAGLL